MIYVGVDPGKSGGIAFIHHKEGKTTTIKTFSVFSMIKKTEQEIWNFFASIDDLEDDIFCMLEKVHAMPGQGVTSMFSFGQNYGFLTGCLTSAQIPFEEVSPRTWQKGLGIPARDSKGGESKAQFKDRLRQKAQQLFPQELVWERTLGEQRAVCDALLIAEYCRRNQ